MGGWYPFGVMCAFIGGMLLGGILIDTATGTDCERLGKFRVGTVVYTCAKVTP